MKIAVQCESPLLQRSLELFLAPYLSTFKQCDVVVRDRRIPEDAKPSLVVAASDGDLVKPFSRSQLMLALEQMFDRGKQAREAVAITEALEASPETAGISAAAQPEGAPDFALLEQRLEELTREYQQNVMKAVRAFYEK
jgi:hypothetical protein